MSYQQLTSILRNGQRLLEDVDCFQLPCVEEFNDEVIANIVQNRGTPPNIPCHSQTVKRAVKLTSDSSKKAVSLRKEIA